MKVVFILGSGHCGSTLLDMMLDNHSGVVGVGEMHGLRSDSVCTCGKAATDCSFWSRVASSWERQEIFRTKFDFLRHGSDYRNALTGEVIDVAMYRKRVVDMYRAMDATVIVDSSKSVDRAEVLQSDPEIQPVFIHLVRDGRAVTWSYLRKYHRLVPFFFKWAAENIKISLFRRRARGPWLLIRYEDLTDDPKATLERICEVIGIRFQETMLSFREGEHHQIGGNRMRFGSEHEIRPDETWRVEMPRGYRVAFDILFGWLNLLYKRA